MSDRTQELSEIKSQERMNYLIEEVTSKKPEEVSPLTRAFIAVEMAKDAIDSGKITPQEGLSFADSLMDYNGVPVVIGTPECKIFPIELIIKARPVIVDSFRNAARLEGIDLDSLCDKLRSKAQGVSDLLEINYESISRSYSPFQLSINDIQKEAIAKSQSKAAVEELLSGQPNPQDKQTTEAANAFIKLNFANFIAGQELSTFVKENYQIA
ncbi:MAG TPA: hypothetical protein VL401_00905 [Alphaproteobacteria bacterium]|jgi:hypothetical protein|nr:hypothetical protein [Alphaproteobacteria bacterium]